MDCVTYQRLVVVGWHGGEDFVDFVVVDDVDVVVVKVTSLSCLIK